MWRVPQFVSEDIDMSLRAIAKGWRIQYHHEPLSRGEVIPSYISYKNQQEKWSGGFMRAIRFNLKDILFGSGKFWAGLHLTSLIFCYLQLILPLFLLPLLPTALLVEHGSLWHCNAAIVALGLMSLFSPFNFMSLYCQYALYDDSAKKSLKLMSGSKYALGISFVVLKRIKSKSCCKFRLS
jgi:cellulose synthase/poly-beta-1,6-N-acetylglucosamine synthase-like glycosyltransferase